MTNPDRERFNLRQYFDFALALGPVFAGVLLSAPGLILLTPLGLYLGLKDLEAHSPQTT